MNRVAHALFVLAILALLVIAAKPCKASETPVYDCLMAGGSKTECLKRSVPSKEMFIRMRMDRGISRQAAAASWPISRSTKSVTCSPNGKDISCVIN